MSEFDVVAKELDDLRCSFDEDAFVVAWKSIQEGSRALHRKVELRQGQLLEETQKCVDEREKLTAATRSMDVEGAKQSLTATKHSLQTRNKEMETLQAEIRKVEEQKRTILAELSQLEQSNREADSKYSHEVQTAKNELSLFHCISGIVWHECTATLCEGNVTRGNEQSRIFSLDMSSFTPYELTNRIWALLE